MNEPSTHSEPSNAANPPAIPAESSGGFNLPVTVNYPFGITLPALRRFCGLLALITIGGVFLFQVQSVLTPFIIAFFLAALLDPSLRYQEQHGRYFKSRVSIVLLYYLLGLVFLILLIEFVGPLAVKQVQDISKNLGNYYNSIQLSVNHFLFTHQKTLHFIGIKQTKLSALLNDRSGPVQQTINAFLSGVSGLAQSLFSHLLWFVIIPVSAFFLMRDYPKLRKRLIWLFPDGMQERVDTISLEVVEVFSAYLRGLAKICALYSFSAFILFELFGVHYALFLGLMAGVFYAVPYIGNLITALSAGALAFLSPHHALFLIPIKAHSLPYTILVIACCISLANIVFDQMVYPRVVGGSVGLHPVVSLFALASGATLFGVWGMLLATPVAASIQIILGYLFPKLKRQPPILTSEDNIPLQPAGESIDKGESKKTS